MEQVKIDR